MTNSNTVVSHRLTRQ